MDTITLEKVEVKTEKTKLYSIILFNDDVNSFDHVIECLMDVCGQGSIQAEQCATLVHMKGKCDIKSGEYSKLEPIATALLDRDLSVEIQ